MPPKDAAPRRKGPGTKKGSVINLATKTLADLDLSTEVTQKIRDIQVELADAYQQRFLEMMDLIRQQTSMLARVQETVHILVRAIEPKLADSVPAAVQISPYGVAPDLASALIVADPIGAGYTLTQAELAKALDLSGADVSVLARAFRLQDDADCAVTVRNGARSKIVNYHPRAVSVLRGHIVSPPRGLDLLPDQRAALKRVRRRLGLTG